VDLTQLREWALTLSACAALLIIAASAWLGARAYRRKLHAEERLITTNRAEADVRLVQAYIDLVLLGAGSGRYALNDELIRAMIECGAIQEDDFDIDNPTPLHTKIARLALMPGVGGGPTAHNYALSGIAILAARQPELRELGIKALELERVRDINPDKVRDLLTSLRGIIRPDEPRS
jgi:hypothetical protein